MQNSNTICTRNLDVTDLPRTMQNKKYKICRNQENWVGNVMSKCSQHRTQSTSFNNKKIYSQAFNYFINLACIKKIIHRLGAQ